MSREAVFSLEMTDGFDIIRIVRTNKIANGDSQIVEHCGDHK